MYNFWQKNGKKYFCIISVMDAKARLIDKRLETDIASEPVVAKQQQAIPHSETIKEEVVEEKNENFWAR